MRPGATDIAEFYSQLALLTRAGMPLPGSLQQLARNAANPAFQKVLHEVQERTARGERLADALRLYPGHFDRLQLSILAAGESAGVLPETLHSLARYLHFAHVMGGRILEILTYPLVTMHLAVILFLGISMFIIPDFSEVAVEMHDGDTSRLPAISKVVFAISAFVTAHRGLVSVFYGACLVATIGFLAGARSTHRAFSLALYCLPGGRRLLSVLDSTRISTLWSLLMRHRTPMPDILVTSSAVVRSPFLAAALVRAAERVRSGASAKTALDREPAVDPLLSLTLQYTPEDRLPDELDRLAEVFEQQVAQTARLVSLALAVITLLFVVAFCGFLIIGMFAPLITIARSLVTVTS